MRFLWFSFSVSPAMRCLDMLKSGQTAGCSEWCEHCLNMEPLLRLPHQAFDDKSNAPFSPHSVPSVYELQRSSVPIFIRIVLILIRLHGGSTLDGASAEGGSGRGSSGTILTHTLASSVVLGLTRTFRWRGRMARRNCLLNVSLRTM